MSPNMFPTHLFIALFLNYLFLQLYSQMCKREEDKDICRVMEIEVSGKRRRWRPKPRWSDTIQMDMRCWDLKKGDTLDRDWRHSIVQLDACKMATQTGLQSARWERWENTWREIKYTISYSKKKNKLFTVSKIKLVYSSLQQLNKHVYTILVL